MRVWKWQEAGWKQKDIAAALGVSEGTVSQWFKKARARGGEALHHQPLRGRQAQRSPEQLAQLPTALAEERPPSVSEGMSGPQHGWWQ
jgi:transposase